MDDLTVKVSDILISVKYLEQVSCNMREVLVKRQMFEGVSWSDAAFAECIGSMKSLCEQAAVEAGLLENKEE
jgi:hypothetical protein